jgi:hypothetical protein
MDIILRRNVKTKSYRLLMDISKSEKREDIVAILMLTAENYGRVTPADICANLLANRPITVGKRIISRCIELGILEGTNENASLTDDGRRAVEAKTVFLPERGLYQILYSDDVLLQNPLLDCVPDDRVSEKDEDKEEIDQSIRDNLENRYFKLLGKQRNEIFIKNIELYGRTINRKPNLDLTYSLLENGNIIVRLNGDYDTKIEPPKHTQLEIWNLIMESMNLDGEWDPDMQCLRRSFEELQDNERINFTVDLRTNSLTIEEMGTFNEILVKKIPIIPKTERDAQNWAIWLLKNAINDYLKSQEYENLVQTILKKFPGYNLKLPSQLELARMIRGDDNSENKLPPAYWYLKAPIDVVGVM